MHFVDEFGISPPASSDLDQQAGVVRVVWLGRTFDNDVLEDRIEMTTGRMITICRVVVIACMIRLL